MKRIAATLFLLVYLVTSTGATIQRHYCMDKIVSWSFSTTESSHCGKCGMEQQGHKGCCHDENKTIKLGKDYKAAFTSCNFLKPPALFFKNSFAATEYLNVFRSVFSFPKSNAPPVVKTVPVYLSISVFRI